MSSKTLALERILSTEGLTIADLLEILPFPSTDARPPAVAIGVRIPAQAVNDWGQLLLASGERRSSWATKAITERFARRAAGLFDEPYLHVPDPEDLHLTVRIPHDLRASVRLEVLELALSGGVSSWVSQAIMTRLHLKGVL